ncbi:MAG: fibronectin type III domain-containing protein [candidate division Zixibacteria bacterium]|nr:fibronectin type III domain-containing protein [candidate division Zixibacteria bacterium]
MRGKIVILLLLPFLILLSGCERKIKSPTSPDEDFFIPSTPKGIVLKIGDQRIDLFWQVDDTSKIGGYNIYRADSSGVTPALYDSTAVAYYTDRSVKNGQEYFYQISALDKKGFEGYKSKIVSARPNLYGIIINENRKLTNSLNVTLRLIAPAFTSYMLLGDDSVFSNSSWENFSTTRSWVLESGDGEKIVFVKYKDQDGNESFNFYQDKIILDTQAQILSLTEDTQGESKSPGEVIHFRLKSGETPGDAKVDLGSSTNIKLFDDGTNGDQISGDGVYELDYLIPLNAEMEGALVIGHFKDEAGNQAPAFTAPGKVTIQSPPTPVVLFAPSAATQSSLTLYWTQNQDNDFYSYRVYRGKTNFVDNDSLLVNTILSRTVTNYTDTGLSSGTTYYYKVYVYDRSGLFSGSNVEKGTTLENKPPAKVTVSLSAVDSTTLRVSWSQNRDFDFYYYQIFRVDSTQGVTTSIAIISQQSTTSYNDSQLKVGAKYCYYILVHDLEGLISDPSDLVCWLY